MSGKLSLPACLVAALAALGAGGLPRARADAVLQSWPSNVFPKRIEIHVEVAAQVELTTMVLDFGMFDGAGDHVLTVPGPRGAYPVGVDLARGEEFAPLKIQDRSPGRGAGASTGATPAVTAWEGEHSLVARLDGLKAGPLRLRVSFLRLLRRYQGKVTLEPGADRCPLRGPGTPDPTLALTARIRVFRPFDTLVTLGAAARLERPTPLLARLTLAPALLTGTTRARISYSEQSRGIQAHFLAHRTPTADPQGGEDGYFLLIVDADNAAVQTTEPRTLSLVIDRSGSMGGKKLEQARGAALAMLDNLREGDRFNLICFNDQIIYWKASPAPVSAANLASARYFVSKLYPASNTDLNQAIIRGLGGAPCPASVDRRFDAMVLLSDGLATNGVRDGPTIHKNAITHNCLESRIYTFAVGHGADVILLEAIARSARGRNFVLNDDQAVTDLAHQVRTLFEDIYAVRLTGLELSVTGIGARETLPEKPHDLFNGGQVVLVGRYRNPGSGSATVSGWANGKQNQINVPFTAPALEQENGFIKYVWATEKVGELVADIGAGGYRAKLEQKITELGLAYRIQTPFTSFSGSHQTPFTSFAGSPPTSSGGGSSGSDSGGGFAGDLDPLTLALLAGLLLLALGRLRRGAPGQ